MLTSCALMVSAADGTIDQQRSAIYQRVASPPKRGTTEPNGTTGGPSAPGARRVFDPSRQYYYVPSRLAGPTSKPGESEAVIDRSEAAPDVAAALFLLARKALDGNQGSLAYRLAHEVLFFDPHHADARRWLALPLAGTQSGPSITVRRGRRRHPRLGWPAGGYLQITTPHFQITTNDSEATARELARSLEELRSTWRQLFFECWTNTAVLKARDAGRSVRRRRRARHRVVMFVDRDEYVEHIRSIEPRAELTRGYYHAPSRMSFFVGGDRPSLSTWRHEATHQLFHENIQSARHIGDQHNFWIVEGVALYMESLQHCRQWVTLGGLEAERLQSARFRALREGFYLPSQAFAAMSRETLQSDSRIRQLYSQAAGLTHFLMDGQGGRHRGKLMAYIREVYQNRDSLDSLTRLTGGGWDELDRRYREFLDVDDRDLQQLDPDVLIRQLCLGGTSVTDVGFLSLPTLDRVTWLDLFGTQLTDNGTAAIAQATELTQLNLERTQITDQTVARLRPLAKLQQLDLSNTQVTDTGLKTIGKLSQLESLWLTNTRLTDQGLRLLTNLKNLSVLDLSETGTTPTARSQLRQALPQLRSER